MKTLRRPMLVLGAVLAVGLAGCGDGDEADAPTTEDAAEQDTDDQDETAEEEDADQDPAEEDTAEPEETADEAAAAESFTGPTEPVKVTYRMTGEAEVDELTLAWDPPRFAMLFEDGRMIVTEDESIFCDAEGDGCFRMGSGSQGGQMAGGMGPFLGFTSALQEGEELAGTTVTGEAEIVGRSATCTTYDAAQYDPSLQGEGEFCYDADAGVLLRWSGTDSEGTTQTLEAIEVGDPDPSDFEPTGPVQDMPGMGDQDG